MIQIMELKLEKQDKMKRLQKFLSRNREVFVAENIYIYIYIIIN